MELVNVIVAVMVLLGLLVVVGLEPGEMDGKWTEVIALELPPRNADAVVIASHVVVDFVDVDEVVATL